MRDLLDDGKEKEFNEAMDEGLRYAGDAVRQNVEWRLKPYLTNSFYQQFKLVRQYNVRDVINRIQCPMFIADPEDEQFWPGQSKEVYEALVCPKTIVPFTAGEGANWHCEPKARGLYDQRMFDWLSTVLPKQGLPVNIHLTMMSFFRTIKHQVQISLHNRESRENRERSRLCNQGRTLQNVTTRKKPCGKAQSVG